MADVKVRHLDESVKRILKIRASRRGVSLEEAVRSTLSASVPAKRDAFRRRAAAQRSASAAQGWTGPDSTRTIRRERNTRG